MNHKAMPDCPARRFVNSTANPFRIWRSRYPRKARHVESSKTPTPCWNSGKRYQGTFGPEVTKSVQPMPGTRESGEGATSDPPFLLRSLGPAQL